MDKEQAIELAQRYKAAVAELLPFSIFGYSQKWNLDIDTQRSRSALLRLLCVYGHFATGVSA